MASRRLLYLNAYHLTAYRWQAAKLDEEESFEIGERGAAQFAAYLARHPRDSFALLANVAEEGFQLETIPFLSGADRATVIRRKLGQQFFGSSLSTAVSLGREQTRRREERLLLAGLTNPGFFTPWLAALQQAGCALSGIYTQALLGSTLLRRLHVDEERCLLLTVQDQSIRQSYFEKGELRFSRQASLPDSSISGIAQALAGEARKLQQYLTSQRLVARNQPITACLLAHASAHKTIAASCVDGETLRFRLLDLADAAHRCGLKTPPADCRSETLFLHLLAVAPPKAQFADDDQRHAFHLQQLRRGIVGIGAVTLAACLLFAGKQLIDSEQRLAQKEEFSAAAASARLRYADIVRTFPAIPTDNETLRRIINRYAEIETHSSTPQTFYRRLSHALDSAPQIELEAIDWQAASSSGAPATSGSGEGLLAGEIDGAVLRGFLRLDAAAPPRQVLAAFNAFVASLKADPQWRVSVVQQPFDVESGKSLRGGEILFDNEKPRAFTIAIGRRAER
ncbi:hypothetical protein [Rhodocyclus tenuis]|uniref:Monoheme cytochrome SoxX n=1 Tax=Rhodocyclus tenuis TaxID=1066 RepID=A0A840G4Q7_RHOTE|nr:hypothetical protein [Rhodocyclus tenuis]MBB4246916.1 hypothetical protein [Rhodocyclus tenuis]